MNSKKHLHTSFPKRSFPIAWLLFIAVLNIALRTNSIGHALTWDEAWILCSLKSLAGGGELFQHQLWRHPPIYLGFGLLLAPLKEGFEIRMQLLSLGLSTTALLVFISFIAQFFGRRIALMSGLIYTLLPGAMLFDTWIKRDSLVTLFCILALFAFFKRKNLLAGIFLGLGLLSKETAIFFAIALLLLIIVQKPRKASIRTVVAVFLPAGIVAGWWYLFFHQGMTGYAEFFQGLSEEATEFSKPWWYYLAKLRYDLGFPGLLFVAAGLLALLADKKNRGNLKGLLLVLQRKRFLPLFILLPSYLILSLSHGKPPWLTISLYPFWALAMAMGWQFLIKVFANLTQKRAVFSPALNALLVSVPLILLLGSQVVPFNHIIALEKMSPTTVKVMRGSYEMAEAVNKLTAENERLLLLPMIYRIGPTMPDPIFYWHVKPLQIFNNKNLALGYDEFKYQVIRNRIVWALLFPVDGSNQLDIYEKSVQEIDAWGYMLTNGVLLRVDSFWKGKVEKKRN